ncbi:MAG TPA: hypothetical protein VND64_00900 [Pirellulales bacterium]|nr:hypothetical protein [Pirellulales bacterium]
MTNDGSFRFVDARQSVLVVLPRLLTGEDKVNSFARPALGGAHR